MYNSEWDSVCSTRYVRYNYTTYTQSNEQRAAYESVSEADISKFKTIPQFSPVQPSLCALQGSSSSSSGHTLHQRPPHRALEHPQHLALAYRVLRHRERTRRELEDVRKVRLRDEREAALLLALEARLEVARKVLRDDVRALDDAERDPGEVRDVGAERGARDAVDELV